MVMRTQGCVPLSVYCTMYGESRRAVETRMERGIWRKGKEYHKIDEIKERWVDLDAVSEWLRERSVA